MHSTIHMHWPTTAKFMQQYTTKYIQLTTSTCNNSNNMQSTYMQSTIYMHWPTKCNNIHALNYNIQHTCNQQQQYATKYMQSTATIYNKIHSINNINVQQQQQYAKNTCNQQHKRTTTATKYMQSSTSTCNIHAINNFNVQQCSFPTIFQFYSPLGSP